LGYNTKLVKLSEAPKNYEDLLNPKWKGEMLMDDEPYEWYGVLMRHFGRERGVQYMKRLAQQNLSMQRGRTNVAQMLVAGEGAIGITSSGNSALELKEKGAPTRLGGARPVLLAGQYDHAGAATRHILMPQRSFWTGRFPRRAKPSCTSFGRVVARNGIKQRFPELMQKKSRLVDMELMDPKVEKTLIKEFRETFMPTR
jgi:hypothetical protein